MKRTAIAGIAAALVIAFGIWWFSAAQVVKRRTLGLMETATIEEGSGRALRQMSVYSLNGYLAPRVTLDVPSITAANGTFDRAEVESGFSLLANQAKQTTFVKKEIREIAIDGDRGKVVIVVDALVELPTYRPADGVYEVTFDWRRLEDGWKLAGAKWVEIK